MKLTDFLTGVGRPVAYYPSLKKITRSTVATIFLTQFIYWTGKQTDPQGWIYKTQEEIEEETGLTRTEQETARKILRAKKFLEEDFRGLPRKLFYRVNIQAVNRAWDTVMTKKSEKRLKNQHNAEILHYCVQESCIIDCRNPALLYAEIPHAIYTENTYTENTTETTTTTEPVVVFENFENEENLSSKTPTSSEGVAQDNASCNIETQSTSNVVVSHENNVVVSHEKSNFSIKNTNAFSANTNVSTNANASFASSKIHTTTTNTNASATNTDGFASTNASLVSIKTHTSTASTNTHVMNDISTLLEIVKGTGLEGFITEKVIRSALKVYTPQAHAAYQPETPVEGIRRILGWMKHIPTPKNPAGFLIRMAREGMDKPAVVVRAEQAEEAERQERERRERERERLKAIEDERMKMTDEERVEIKKLIASITKSI